MRWWWAMPLKNPSTSVTEAGGSVKSKPILSTSLQIKFQDIKAYTGTFCLKHK